MTGKHLKTPPLPFPSRTAPAEPPARYDYRQDGFTVVPHRLAPDLIEAARARLASMMADLPPGGRPEGLVEPHIRAPDADFWLELCRHPQVLAEVSAAMGAEELILLMSHLIVKPPRDGKAVAWHQDITYWPSVRGEEVCTVWLALDDVDLGNSCMQVIPRSHAREHLEKVATDGTDLLGVRVEVPPELARRAVPCILPAGAFSIHDSFVIHGSTVNTSDRRRAGYTMRYGDATRVEVDLDRHWVPVFYVHGDGSGLKPGMIDLRPGRPLPPRQEYRP